MLSGNGRHRRPRQAPALLVAAGVTGSAIAIPLLGASGASAADGTTWDRVADCETGGAWSANSGYGQYGGLKLSQLDWVSYGGLEYAPGPDQASRRQQIAVAERVLADQGVSAWPACGPLAGLGEDAAPADVDTGVAEDGSGHSGPTGKSTSPVTPDSSVSPKSPDSAASSETSGPSEESDSRGASGESGPGGGPASGASGPGDSPDSAKSDTSDALDPSAGAGATPGSSPALTGEEAGDAPAGVGGPADNSDKSTPNGASSADPFQPGTGRHRGAVAEEGAGGGRAAGSEGRDASGGPAALGAADGEYVVREGDSLSGIADSLDLDGGWRALYDGNRETVGTDPDLIVPGQTLAVGGESGEK